MQKQLLSKISYALLANIVGFFASILTTLLVPRLMGDNVAGFGYFQLFIFYESYIGFFHLGLIDGLYLKDGGKQYLSLDKRYYSSQFWILTLFELVVSTSIVLYGYFMTSSFENRIVTVFLGITILVSLPRAFFSYVLQTTNRIKEYSFCEIAGRITFLSSLVISFIFGIKDFYIFILGDCLNNVVGLLLGVFYCKEIVLTKPLNILVGLRDAFDNIKIGINLLAANIANLLIAGIVRFGVQYKWDIVSFGIISLAISISNLLLVLINAVAMVLYPTLRQVDEERLLSIYPKIRNMLMIPVLGVLVLYYPISSILCLWLPQYADSFKYMAILFPMCIYASKMTLLITTYMKVYRMERTIFQVNCLGVIIAVITTILSVFVFESITLAVLAILINQMLRCVYAELVLSKRLNINVRRDVLTEIILTIVFVASSWCIGGWIGTLLYLLSFMLYLGTNKESLVYLKESFKL